MFLFGSLAKDYNILPWEGLGMAYKAAQIGAIPHMNGFPVPCLA